MKDIKILKDKRIFEKTQFYLVAIFIFTLPYYIGNFMLGTFSILIFLFALFIKKRPVNELFIKPHILVLFIFILFSYLSLFWGISEEVFNSDAKDAIERFKYYPFLIIGIYFSNLKKTQINKILLLLALSPLGYVFIYYTNSLGLTTIYSDHYIGYKQLVDNEATIYTKYLMWDFKANVFIIISMVYFYIKFLNKFSEKFFKIAFLYFVLFLIIFISLFIDEVTDSRLMDMVAIISIVFVTYFFISSKYKFLIILIVGLMSSALVYNMQKDSFDKGFSELKEFFINKNYSGSWGFRVGMLHVGYEILKEKPFLGTGVNSSKIVVDTIRKEKPELLKAHPNIYSFHNEHLLFLTEVGILGYLIFILFIFYYFKLRIHNKNINILKNSIILMYLMLMVADYFISNKSLGNTFAVFIAIFTLYSVLEKEERDNP